jgi:hypothetical protein
VIDKITGGKTFYAYIDKSVAGSDRLIYALMNDLTLAVSVENVFTLPYSGTLASTAFLSLTVDDSDNTIGYAYIFIVTNLPDLYIA